MPVGTRSIHDNVGLVGSIAPQVVTNGTINGSAANLVTRQSQSHGFIIEIGTWTDGVHTFTPEERVAGGAWTAIAAANLDGFAFDGTTQQLAAGLATVAVIDNGRVGQRILIGYSGINDELRLSLVTTGATVGALLGGSVVQGSMRYQGRNPGNAESTF